MEEKPESYARMKVEEIFRHVPIIATDHLEMVERAIADGVRYGQALGRGIEERRPEIRIEP